MKSHDVRDRQAGFSLIELTVTMGIMVAILGVTAGLMADALRSATIAGELTEAQQSLRAAHEYLNRDLIVAGDGLSGVNNVRLPTDFVTDNVTPAPNNVQALSNNRGAYVALPLVTSDDAQSRSGSPAGLLPGSDRLTLMTINRDPGFPISIVGAPASYTRPGADTLIANLPSATAALFRSGEVVLVSSSETGPSVSTFATVTGVTTGSSGQIRFAVGDAYGLNAAGLPLLTDVICGTGNPGTDNCFNVTIQRVLLITYFVDENGLLRRRVLGKARRGSVAETAFTSAAMAGDIVAEHLTAFQARYGVIATNRSTWQIVDQMTAAEESRVREVEVKLTVETPHPVMKYDRHAEATSTVRTSVRTLEYRNAL